MVSEDCSRTRSLIIQANEGASHDRMPSIIICWEQSEGHAFYEVSHLSSLFLPRHNACRKHVALTECNYYQITSAGSCVKATARFGEKIHVTAHVL